MRAIYAGRSRIEVGRSSHLEGDPAVRIDIARLDSGEKLTLALTPNSSRMLALALIESAGAVAQRREKVRRP